jgi:hypothetical protein
VFYNHYPDGVQRIVDDVTSFIGMVDARHRIKPPAWSKHDFDTFYSTEPDWPAVVVRARPERPSAVHFTQSNQHYVSHGEVRLYQW